MSSTNKTTHYELSQFLGTDKPAWLNDYNSDMNKIDAGVNTAQTTATGADSKATANASKIGNLTSLTTTDKTDLVSAVNEVDSNCDVTTGVANNALTTANAANTNATSAMNAVNKLNLVNTDAVSNTRISGGTISGNNVRYASNSDGTVGKIYGSITATITSGSGATITFDTPFRPTESINIVASVLLQDVILPSGIGQNIEATSMTISTTGTVTLTLGGSWNGHMARYMFIPCILFFTDFGDQPANN